MKRKLWLPVVLMLSCGLLTACQSTGEVPDHVGAAGNETVEDISDKSSEEAVPDSETVGGSLQTADEGDSEPTPTLEKESVGEETEVPEHEILLVKRRSNMAWGYQDQGYFIDTDGCVYRFDIAASPVVSETGEILPLIESLKVIRENSEGEAVFDKEFVKQISALGKNLSADDEFYKTHERCDYGQDTLYFYSPETKELLKCKSIGDVDYMPKNESAAEIADLLEETIMQMAREAPYLE